jgi:amino acid transporter
MRNSPDRSPRSAPSFLAAIVAVLSAFVGIRKRGASLADQGIKPLHIVLAAILCVASLIAGIVTIVHLVIANVP